MPLYDFRCTDGHAFERRVGYDVSEAVCQCGEPAVKETIYHVNFGGFASTPYAQKDLSQDFRRYRETVGEIEHQHGRQEEAAQRTLPPPPLFQAAKAKAARLRARGVTAET